jgi:probable FeS assembly SUF system protein SufT
MTPEPTISLENLVWDQLRQCYDPEIPVNIVELGLIYDCRVVPHPDGGHQVAIKMTLTAPGCGMGEYIKADVENRLRAIPGIAATQVELVWDPPWNQEMISEAAKLELGLL